MISKHILFTYFLFFVLTQLVHAQGCSDAGFCTLNSFKPIIKDSTEKMMNNSVKLGVSSARADHSISILSSFIEYSKSFGRNFSIDSKLTFIAQNGNSIRTSGLSDIYLSTNYTLKNKFKITIGSKIPLSNGSKSMNGLVLPMDYQSSLGTVDLIFGVGYEFKKIKFVAAIQQPLTQNNNTFTPKEYSPNSALYTFQSTNKYKRAADVLVRVSYPLKLSNKLILSPSVLPIYHLNQDKFTDSDGKELSIIGSEGLTLNGTFYVDYILNDKNSINLNFGKPFIARKNRPDGLTRKYVVSLDYKFSF